MKKLFASASLRLAVRRGNPPRKAFLCYLGVHGTVERQFLYCEVSERDIPCGLAFTSGLLLSEDFLTVTAFS